VEGRNSNLHAYLYILVPFGVVFWGWGIKRCSRQYFFIADGPRDRRICIGYINRSHFLTFTLMKILKGWIRPKTIYRLAMEKRLIG